jgi:hypothetical protein
MSPQEVIDQTAADGVVLALSGSNTITATGESKRIDRWLTTIRGHKAAIIDVLSRFSRCSAAPFLKKDDSATCKTCEHLRTPGRSAGYCGGRDDLPLAYGVNHPLRKLPLDGGATCDYWRGNN